MNKPSEVPLSEKPGPPVKQTQVPQVQEIKISRRFNGMWEFMFSDNVSMLDVNRVTQRLRREFLKMKRTSRISRQREARRANKGAS